MMAMRQRAMERFEILHPRRQPDVQIACTDHIRSYSKCITGSGIDKHP